MNPIAYFGLILWYTLITLFQKEFLGYAWTILLKTGPEAAQMLLANLKNK
jgi:hypothetical protein